jgi:hypothetical protein
MNAKHKQKNTHKLGKHRTHTDTQSKARGCIQHQPDLWVTM